MMALHNAEKMNIADATPLYVSDVPIRTLRAATMYGQLICAVCDTIVRALRSEKPRFSIAVMFMMTSSKITAETRHIFVTIRKKNVDGTVTCLCRTIGVQNVMYSTSYFLTWYERQYCKC